MVRRSTERTVDVKKMFDGAGQARLVRIRETPEELYNKGRVFSHLFLEPGCEVGYHVHHGDGEIYYILKGQGEYNDNGQIVTVGPGDVTFVDAEEGHGLVNKGPETLEAIALILYK